MTLNNKIQLSLIAFTVLSLSLITFLIYPIFKDIKNNAMDLSFKKQDLTYLDNKLSNIEEFKEGHEEIKENLKKAESLFAKAEAPVDFIGFLEEISSDSNISIQISPSCVTRAQKDIWSSIVFQIDGLSNFRNLLKFIEKLESGPFLTEIKELTIKRLTEENLKIKELAGYSVGDAKSVILIKVFANQSSSL